MVLKWSFVDDTGEETANLLFRSPGRLETVTPRRFHEIAGHSVVTVGEESLHSSCWGLPAQSSWAGKVLLRRWSWNYHLWVTLRSRHSLFKFSEIQSSLEFYLEDGNEIIIHWCKLRRHSVQSLLRSHRRQCSLSFK